MLSDLEILPPDPILGLTAQFKQDDNPEKINLGVGVYKDETGNTPIFKSVKQAETRLVATEKTKAYISQEGDPDFIRAITQLTLGQDTAENNEQRISAVMTPGGTGALRMLAELINSTKTNPMVWLSNPTWGNHKPVMEKAGLQTSQYSYYEPESGLINFEAMIQDLSSAQKGDVILLHACCHNPTGADMTYAQWDQVIELCKQKQLIPLIDIAYQGFGNGLSEDGYAPSKAVETLPEVLIAVSCSKNFSVYRERAGLALVAGESEQSTKAAQSHIVNSARTMYSMSPYHGAGIVGLLLKDTGLTQLWLTEINETRQRINELRQEFSDKLNQAQNKRDFTYVAENRGMFSMLGLSKPQVERLRNEFGLYILNSSRINIAGMSQLTIDSIVEKIAKVL